MTIEYMEGESLGNGAALLHIPYGSALGVTASI